MNERIRELLVEAHKQTKGGIYSGHPSEWTEKFAELIVKECAKRSAELGQSEIGLGLLKHFGVEE